MSKGRSEEEEPGKKEEMAEESAGVTNQEPTRKNVERGAPGERFDGFAVNWKEIARTHAVVAEAISEINRDRQTRNAALKTGERTKGDAQKLDERHHGAKKEVEETQRAEELRERMEDVEQFWHMHDVNSADNPDQEKLKKIEKAIKQQENEPWKAQQHDLYLAKKMVEARVGGE